MLAMVGLYGIVSFMVIRRRNEIGIRMALGADKTSILRMILREAVGSLGAGRAIGIVLVLGVGGVAQALLYGIKANDAVSVGLAAGALAVAAVCASLIPASAFVHPDTGPRAQELARSSAQENARQKKDY